MNGLRKTAQAAGYLGLNPGTLANLRARGLGPRYVKLGSAVRYYESDLDAWAQAHLVETEAGL
jgi:predicted DNA-binding transcriptional regulator AlpA